MLGRHSAQASDREAASAGSEDEVGPRKIRSGIRAWASSAMIDSTRESRKEWTKGRKRLAKSGTKTEIFQDLQLEMKRHFIWTIPRKHGEKGPQRQHWQMRPGMYLPFSELMAAPSRERTRPRMTGRQAARR